MDIRVLVGRNVARLRVERAMTQEALSEQSGITQSYLSQIENGHTNLTLLHIHDLSQALAFIPVSFSAMTLICRVDPVLTSADQP